jgi:two-component system phosphate regulon response regulator PhoB
MRAARPLSGSSGPASSGRIPAAQGGQAARIGQPAAAGQSGAGERDDLASTGERLAWSDSEAPPSSALESSRVPFVARVLLVDEDEQTRNEVRTMLSEIGLVVDAVGTADEAHAHLGQTSYDALVLDFHGAQGPGVEPLDFVRGLRRDPVRAPLPVLILSHRPSSRDVVDAFASGADDFLPKPFRAPELGARIFGLLRRARLARLGSVVPGTTSGSGPRSSGGRGGGS